MSDPSVTCMDGFDSGFTPDRRLSIALVSDFSYPRMGGVEMHQYYLAQGLIRRKHKVILITGTYEGERQGVRYLSQGLKVYYCPIRVIVQQAGAPTLLCFLPLFRNILIREKIDVVHGHQSTSALAAEAIVHAKTMGFKAIYTDHSLFGFADAAAIHVNKLIKMWLTEIDHVICVSHTSRENLVLRAYLDPRDISVIPNAVDATKFTPDPTAAPPTKDRINIVLLSRLVYRKGIDLAVDVIPEICARFSNVYFIIGGDGPKRILLEEMREKYQLHDRIEMLGAIQHSDVRNVLVRGHIFLNCSLTEAFCIAILEAVSCGLYTVSTRVGGISEVLPESMITLTEPSAPDIIEAVAKAIGHVRRVRPQALHEEVRRMYNWNNVVERTERVYFKVLKNRPEPLSVRLRRYYACGPAAGLMFSAMIALNYLWFRLIDRWMPASSIDEAVDFPDDLFADLDDNDFMVDAPHDYRHVSSKFNGTARSNNKILPHSG